MARKLVCIGDSLTEGFGVARELAWPALLHQCLQSDRNSPIEVVNCGISGDTTGGMLARFSADVVARRPDYVIVMGGGNDLWWNVEQNHILANLYAMVKQAFHHSITPIVGIAPPFDLERVNRESVWEPVGGFADCWQRACRLSQALRTLCEDNGWLCLDFSRLFTNRQGEVNKSYFTGGDGVHPNQAGHEAMAKWTAAFIKDRLEGV